MEMVILTLKPCSLNQVLYKQMFHKTRTLLSERRHKGAGGINYIHVKNSKQSTNPKMNEHIFGYKDGFPGIRNSAKSLDVAKYGTRLMKNSSASPDHLLLFGARCQVVPLSRPGRP